MARVRVPISDEDITAALSKKAAKILGEEPKKEEPAPRRRPELSKRKIIYLVAGLVSVLIITGFVIVIQDRNKLKSQVTQLKTPSSSQDETQQLIDYLNQFMELPTGETPTLATVSNVEELKSQNFFKNAQNGDKVLLYAKEGKAMLYRPSSKKLIEVAPINTNGSATIPAKQ